MAHKGGYPGYPTQPPAPAGYAPPGYAPPGYAPPGYAAPPAYPGATNTVVIQQQQPVIVGKSSRGLLGQLGHELNVLGKTVSREVDWTSNQINKSLATTASGNLLSLFQTGNVIQLVSRSNGGCLEIVQGPTGLTVDGRGPEGAQHATWTVINEGNNQVRLHNNNNFLSIMNGTTVLINMPAGVMQGVETKLQLFQVGQFVYIESMKEGGRHIGILPTGELKSALATGKETHSQFGVRLLYSPYQPATVTTVTHKR